MRKSLASVLVCAAVASTGGAACSKRMSNDAKSEAKELAAEPSAADHLAEPADQARNEGRAGAVADKQAGGGESYTDHGVNATTRTADDRFSTFAIDVDTASYTIARRKLREGTLPPAAAVRVEEFVNYFSYGYDEPRDGKPFAIHIDGAPSPLTDGMHIVRIGLQADRIDASERKRANLVFLVDVSGSMDSPDKLGLAKSSLRILVDSLRSDDTVSIVTYAAGTQVVLPATPVARKDDILAGIEGLRAGGSTAMADGLALAYEQAGRNLGPDSISRVIVLSDGDANIGSTTHQEILDRLDGYVKEGVTLSTIGFGMGNYKDTMMEQLADRGNGNYSYVDDQEQAVRLFRDQLTAMLQVVAKDVKIQVEFIPEAVASYRLVGYENRDVADEDFRNDRVDAGEIGAGHSVTALYEVALTGTPGPIARVRLRAKAPRGETATESEVVMSASQLAPRFETASADLRFATAVMGAAEILRKSPRAAAWSLSQVRDIARAAMSTGDTERSEFVRLLDRALELTRSGS